MYGILFDNLTWTRRDGMHCGNRSSEVVAAMVGVFGCVGNRPTHLYISCFFCSFFLIPNLPAIMKQKGDTISFRFVSFISFEFFGGVVSWCTVRVLYFNFFLYCCDIVAGYYRCDVLGW